MVCRSIYNSCISTHIIHKPAVYDLRGIRRLKNFFDYGVQSSGVLTVIDAKGFPHIVSYVIFDGRDPRLIFY